MFLGKSGTGKSTHARMWLKYIQGTDLVNDDNPVVRVANDGTAVVYGSPVCFGPNHSKFQEANDILSLGGGIYVLNSDDLSSVLNNWLSDNNSWQAASEICHNYTQSNKGSAKKILEVVETFIK